MKDVKMIELEGIKYFLVNTVIINNIEYFYLANVEDPRDFTIRKTEVINGEEMLVGLDSREEFDEALTKLGIAEINN